MMVELVKMLLRTTSVMNGKTSKACCLVVDMEGRAAHFV